MVTIIIEEDKIINAVGHAKDKPACGLFTGLVTTIVNMYEMLDDAECIRFLEDGHFCIQIDKIHTDKGLFLADGLITNLKQLANQYPDSFEIVYYKKCK